QLRNHRVQSHIEEAAAFDAYRFVLLQDLIPHLVGTGLDELFFKPAVAPGVIRVLQCCEKAYIQFDRKVTLFTDRGAETVKIKTFEIAMRLHRSAGVSYEAALKALFVKPFDTTNSSKPSYYKDFMIAVREFEKLWHLIWHGRFTKEILDVKGYAKKYNVKFGGGGNYGESGISEPYFKDYLERAVAKVPERNCRSRLVAGTFSKAVGGRTDSNGVFGTFCPHGVSDTFYGDLRSCSLRILIITRRDESRGKLKLCSICIS
ncbi:hypothetical protein HDU96_000214, partial [Phlyctochytrium bullatum]